MEDDVIASTGEEEVLPQETEVIESEPKSMDDTIRETLEAIEARNSEPETAEQKAERLRDEKGRFAKAEEAAPNAEAQEAPKTEVPEEPTSDPAPAPVVPPELQRLGLRKEEAEAFAKADKTIQDAFIRRSEEMHKGFEQVRHKAQLGDMMERAITPYAQQLQQIGIGPDVAFQRLMQAENALRNGTPEQKVMMLHKLANDYQIDIGHVQEYQANRPYVDPQVSQLQTQLQQMQSWVQQQQQQREWQERQTLNSEIEKFKSDPANVHFEAVKNDMAGLLQAGLASSLKDAYDKAIYANPTIRSQVIAKQQAEEAERAKQEAAQKAIVAKRAAVVNMPRKGVAPPAKPVGSIDDTIRETAQRLGLL